MYKHHEKIFYCTFAKAFIKMQPSHNHSCPSMMAFYRICALLYFAVWSVTDAYSQAELQVVPIDGFEKAQGYRVVHNIVVEGNRVTKRNIITRELSFRQGDTLALHGMNDLLLINKQRLLNLPLFTAVDFHDSTISDSLIDIHIKVRERWYFMPEFSFKLADRNFNVWWYEQNHNLRRINIGCDLKHSNVFGNMEQLGIILQGGYTQRLGLLYAKPYIDARQRHGAGLQIVYSRSQEIPYNTDLNKLAFARNDQVYLNKNIEASLFYTYRPEYATRHLVQLSYRQFKIGDTIRQLNPEYFLNNASTLKYLELTYRVDVNKTDNWNYSLKGEKLVTTLTQRIGWEGMRAQTQWFVEAAWMREFAKKWYHSFVVKGRLSLPQKQPYLLVNALGYDTKYLRGYEYYVIDGSHFVMGRMALKIELWKHTFKKIPFRYLPELPIRVYPKVYVDAGYCYNQYAGNSTLNNRWLRSGGIGIDLVTAYDIKLKLEYSINHLGQRGFYFHQHGD